MYRCYRACYDDAIDTIFQTTILQIEIKGIATLLHLKVSVPVEYLLVDVRLRQPVCLHPSCSCNGWPFQSRLLTDGELMVIIVFALRRY